MQQYPRLKYQVTKLDNVAISIKQIITVDSCRHFWVRRVSGSFYKH